MTSSTAKREIKRLQAALRCNYTTAKTYLDEGKTSVVYVVQGRSREDFQRPYPWFIEDDSRLRRQSVWARLYDGVIGFANTTDEFSIELSWEDFVANPQDAVGQLLVTVSAEGGITSHMDVIESVKVLALPPLSADQTEPFEKARVAAGLARWDELDDEGTQDSSVAMNLTGLMRSLDELGGSVRKNDQAGYHASLAAALRQGASVEQICDAYSYAVSAGASPEFGWEGQALDARLADEPTPFTRVMTPKEREEWKVVEGQCPVLITDAIPLDSACLLKMPCAKHARLLAEHQQKVASAQFAILKEIFETPEGAGRCPDGGTCESKCREDVDGEGHPCQRVVQDVCPRGGVYPGDQWPDELKGLHSGLDGSGNGGESWRRGYDSQMEWLAGQPAEVARTALKAAPDEPNDYNVGALQACRDYLAQLERAGGQ